ncbi:MAG: hypothetical protein KME50_11715 [Nostoc desertorum CM1-VF14]|nr:hypothetical protein [Nostoc desertorum CM1-VF14]
MFLVIPNAFLDNRYLVDFGFHLAGIKRHTQCGDFRTVAQRINDYSALFDVNKQYKPCTLEILPYLVPELS